MPLDDRKLEILDFNVDPESEVVEATVIPRGQIFEDMVVSRLPYFETKKVLQESYHGVMIDNDRIVALSVSPSYDTIASILMSLQVDDVFDSAVIDKITVFTF